VEMPDESEAQNAIGELNGKDLKGRTIIVNKARPQTDRGGGGGGRGGGGFGGRRY
jgi:RNA recognition motif-containing protein